MSDSEHRVVVEGSHIRTSRLTLRPWQVEDAQAALAVYGADDVTRWLAPAMVRAHGRDGDARHHQRLA